MGKKDRARLGAAQDTLDLRVSALETSLISRLDGLDRENTALKEKVRALEMRVEDLIEGNQPERHGSIKAQLASRPSQKLLGVKAGQSSTLASLPFPTAENTSPTPTSLVRMESGKYDISGDAASPLSAKKSSTHGKDEIGSDDGTITSSPPPKFPAAGAEGDDEIGSIVSPVVAPPVLARSVSGYGKKSAEEEDEDEAEDELGSMHDANAKAGSICSVTVTPSGKVVLPKASFRRQASGIASRATQKLVREYQTGYEGVFTIQSELGQGMFGAVTEVTHKVTGEKYAMKHINFTKVRGDATVTMLLTLREIELMKKLDHPHIIKIDSVFRKADDLYVVMEYCSGKELQDKLDACTPLPCPEPFPPMVARFQVHEAQKLAKDMLGAISYLHNNGIVHRDLKLENFIFAGPGAGEGAIKLIDFGLSRASLDTGAGMTADVGSVIYKAPEVLTGNYTEASDLWSLGVMCHMMVTGIVPWQGNSRKEVEASIKSEIEQGLHGYLEWFYTTMQISEVASDFMKSLLTVEVPKRMTCKQAVQHPWISGGNVRQQLLERRTSRTSAAGVPGAFSLEMANKLKKFREQSKLTQTALLAVTFSADAEELKKLGEAFSAADKDQDGLISREDFAALMSKFGVKDPVQLATYFDAVNQDGTGMIKYSEFVAALLEESFYTSDKQLEAAFNRLDLSGSGEISAKDLKAMLGRRYSKRTIAAVLGEADTTGTGKIGLKDFKAAIIGAAARGTSDVVPLVVEESVAVPSIVVDDDDGDGDGDGEGLDDAAMATEKGQTKEGQPEGDDSGSGIEDV